MSRIATLDRPAALRRLADESFDLVIVGGGITGAGVAREAALAGYSVALVEARDFASGTSSRSSKLIHGGLRYLAMGDFGLVRQTALERRRVHAMAPHLADPGWLMIPCRNWFEAIKYRVAVGVYERLGEVPATAGRRSWNAAGLARHEPLVRTDHYPHACVHQEYVTDDARLVLATLRAAVAAGAVVANYAPVRGLLHASGRVAGVTVWDEETAAPLEVRGRVVVNAAGPWAAELARSVGSALPKALQLSKGVHLVLARKRLPVRHMALLPFPDGRLIFVVPRGDIVWVGTTDTAWNQAAAGWPLVEAAEVDYLLGPLARFYDVEPLGREDVLATWAGLRPLIAAVGRAPKELSRRDEVWVGDDGLVSIAGGKLTGFRHMAAEVLGTVSELLGRPAPAGDNLSALPGGEFNGDMEGLAAGLRDRHGIGAESAARLARMYGSEAGTVLDRGSEPLAGNPRLFRGEVVWAAEVEGARKLEDVLYRRSGMAMFGVVPGEFQEAVASQLGQVLGWDAARCRRELDEVRALDSSQRAWRDAEAATGG